MIQKSTLIRSASKVAAYIAKYIRTAGADNREEVLQLFDNMHRLFPHWVISTCPVMHPDIQYISKNGPFVFGYSNNQMVEISSMDKFFHYIHDSDQEDLLQCFSALHDFLASIPGEDHHRYRAILHYRFKKSDGQYIYLHDEKSSLDLRGSNLYFALFRDITADKAFSGVKLELFKQEIVLHKIKEFKPSSERNPLSKREEELVTLIKQGLSTKEIAWYLKISPNTVRNIKSRLFEKYNVNNSIELLNIAG